MKAGIVEALDIAVLCRATHISLMIGAMIESRLAIAMSAPGCWAWWVLVHRSRLMQPEVTQYLMRATAELAELLGIAV